MQKKIAFVTTILTFLMSASPVFAHAVVKPDTAGVGAFIDFSLGVPSEKDAATVKVQLMIPTGLANISPIVKPGWKIDVKSSPDPSGAKDDDGNPAQIVSEIDWTGGQVPAHQKDFFMLSAQVPAQPGELDWKAVQTYSDGSTISWTIASADQQPKDDKGNPDFSKFGPVSKTMVINDLKPSAAPTEQAMAMAQTTNTNNSNSSTGNVALAIAGLALVLSALSLGMQFMKKKTNTPVQTN